MKYYVEVNKIGTFWFSDHEMNISHREDGPAIEYKNGNKYWYLNDIEYTEKEFKVKMAYKFDRSDAVNLARNIMDAGENPTHQDITKLCRAVLDMDEVLKGLK